MAVLNCLSGSGMARRSGRNSPFHGFAQTHALCGASAHHNQTGKKQIKTKRGRHGSPLLRIRPTQRSSCGVSQKNGKVRGETPILQGRKRQRREGAIKLLETGWPSSCVAVYRRSLEMQNGFGFFSSRTPLSTSQLFRIKAVVMWAGTKPKGHKGGREQRLSLEVVRKFKNFQVFK